MKNQKNTTQLQTLYEEKTKVINKENNEEKKQKHTRTTSLITSTEEGYFEQLRLNLHLQDTNISHATFDLLTYAKKNNCSNELIGELLKEIRTAYDYTEE